MSRFTPMEPRLDEHFEVGEALPHQGVAQVRRARARAGGRAAVLKYPGPGLDQADQARLRREAARAAALDHPNLARFLGLFRDQRDQLVLAYEDCGGLDLLARGRQGPAEVDEVLGWIEDVAAGLDALHGAGMVLRDLKPENVVLGDDGRARLVDFGLLRRVSGDTVTGSAYAAGTAETMAPELFRGAAADPASDRYALAVTGYELLSGRLPFTGSPAALASAHLNDPPPPLAAPGEPLARLDPPLRRGMAKDPAARPKSAGELARLLREAWEGRGAGGPPPASGTRPPAPAPPRAGTRPLAPATPRAGTRPLVPAPPRAGTRPLAPAPPRAGTRPLASAPPRAGTRPLAPATPRAGTRPLAPAEAPGDPPPPRRAGGLLGSAAALALALVVGRALSSKAGPDPRPTQGPGPGATRLGPPPAPAPPRPWDPDPLRWEAQVSRLEAVRRYREARARAPREAAPLDEEAAVTPSGAPLAAYRALETPGAQAAAWLQALREARGRVGDVARKFPPVTSGWTRECLLAAGRVVQEEARLTRQVAALDFPAGIEAPGVRTMLTFAPRTLVNFLGAVSGSRQHRVALGPELRPGEEAMARALVAAARALRAGEATGPGAVRLMQVVAHDLRAWFFLRLARVPVEALLDGPLDHPGLVRLGAAVVYAQALAARDTRGRDDELEARAEALAARAGDGWDR